MVIDRPNHIWATDITYIRMRHGFLYLCAILDWATRKVLALRLSNTLTRDFCTATLKEALARYGTPCRFLAYRCTSAIADMIASQVIRQAFIVILVPACPA